ncbi:MAG: ABC transporter permease [Chloroflexi bacterium]|nr:ABC transporter permease [Chloroflexota bacterium]
MVPVLIGTSLVVFIIVRLLPGDPAIAMLGTSATPGELVRMRHLLGLDEPVYIQYLRFLADIARGNFGDSISRGVPALQVVMDTLPATIELAVTSMLLSIVIAVPLGVIAAVRQHSIIDYASMIFALAGVSMPIFWLGILMILLFSLQLHWLSPFGRGAPLADAMFTAVTTGDTSVLIDSLKHIIMPAAALGVNSMGLIARITRSSMLEVLSQDYVRTAKAKGLKEQFVLTRHAIRNALLPIITILGLQFGALLGGAVVTETIFAWPGVGRLVVQGINQRDFPVVQTTVMVMAVCVCFLNLLIDLSYAYINPRIRYS